MDPLLSILQRNLNNIDSNAWFLGIPSTAEPDPSFSQCFASTFDAIAFQSWQSFNIHLGWDEPKDNCKQIIIYLPKSKPEAKLLINWAESYLAESGGRIWIVGHNSGGIKSAPNLAKSFGYESSKVDSARHCAIFEFNVKAGKNLEKPFDYEKLYSKYKLDSGIEISALAGVFSHQKLDRGTKLLLDQLSLPKKGNVLDFGCGAGVLGASILAQNAKLSVDFIDVSLLAIESTKTTLKNNGLAGNNFICNNGLQGIAQNYHLIVSNPPFHEGVKTNYDVTEKFITEAYSRLYNNGELFIVANQFLGYEAIMTKIFGNVSELKRGDGFKILKSIKSK